MVMITTPKLTLLLLILTGSLSYGMDGSDPYQWKDNRISEDTNPVSKRFSISDLKVPAIKDLPLMISSSVAPFAAHFSTRSLIFSRGSIFCNGAVLASQLLYKTTDPFLNTFLVFSSSSALYCSCFYYFGNHIEKMNKVSMQRAIDSMGMPETFSKMKSAPKPSYLKYLHRGNVGFSLFTPLLLVCITNYGETFKKENVVTE